MSFFKKFPTIDKKEEAEKIEKIRHETEDSDFMPMWLSSILYLWLPAVAAIILLSILIYYIFT